MTQRFCFARYLMKLRLLSVFTFLLAASAPAQDAPTAPPRPSRASHYVVPKPAHPVPILPALPAPEDKSFYAERDVPHGRVEIVHYKTSAGTEKRMHVYLPPGYET